MNTIGRRFRVSIFGESHGELIGVTLDGVPAGIALSSDDLERDILRRKSGAKGTTPRLEADVPMIISGVYDGHTTGAPLTVAFKNTNSHSSDYRLFADMPRPGHADFTAAVKWDDCHDPRGGGHFSGRLTLPVVAAGVIAKKILADATMLDETPMQENGISARIIELGGIPLPSSRSVSSVQPSCRAAGPSTFADEADMPEKPVLPTGWQQAIDDAIREGDSLGAVIECIVPQISVGYGEPFWDSVESMISHAVFAVPGVRAIEFGDGFAAAGMKGSEHNDPIGADGRPLKNGAGGVNGGLTNGAPIVFRVAMKPTSSIRKCQHTYNFSKEEMDMLEIPGRHDVCFALRAPVVVEAMTAIALADLVLLGS